MSFFGKIRDNIKSLHERYRSYEQWQEDIAQNIVKWREGLTGGAQTDSAADQHEEDQSDYEANLEQFWEIVDHSAQYAGNDAKQIEALKARLETLSQDELISFKHADDIYSSDAYSWLMWGAAYVINSGCSDDGFEYFRSWLISRGSKVCRAAVNDPDSLAELQNVGYAEFELFSYVVDEVYEAKFGTDIPIIYRGTGSYDPKGEQWEEEDLPQLLPKLSAKYL